MNDTGALFLIGALSFVILILIAVFKKVQETYGARNAIRYFVLSIISIITVAFLFWNFLFKPCPNCGCDNVDDCLSKNKFDEARKYAAAEQEVWRPKYLYKIIIAETQYWMLNNELKRANNTLKELMILDVDEFEVKEEEKYKKYFELSNSIIFKYCEKNLFDKALTLANELPKKHFFIENEYISKKQEYNGLKNWLKANQEIEVWKGSDYYEITTYVYPREEALKIIAEYKNEK